MEKNYLQLTGNPKWGRVLRGSAARCLWKGGLLGLLLFAAWVPNAHTQGCTGMSISDVTVSPSCASKGANVAVTISFTGIGHNNQLHYQIAFANGTDPTSSNTYWYPSGADCTNGNNTWYTSPVATNFVTVGQTIQVPNPLPGYTIDHIIVVARDSADGSRPHCDGGNCTEVFAVPFTAPCGTPTKTPTPTYTPTKTHTPLPGGPTNTPTFTRTPINTPTPSLTPTPTNTFTPTFTYTPHPYYTPTPPPICDPPSGANSQNVQGPTTCFANQTALLDSSYVFGMSLAQVKNLADYTGSSLGTPVTLDIQGDWKLSYFTGDLTYDPSYPAPYDRLHAFGVLIVDGNLTLNSSTGSTLPSSYGGVIFITGNLTIGAGCEIDGSVIVGSGSPTGGGAGYYYNGKSAGVATGIPNIILNGAAGEFGQIIYSPSLVARAQQLVGEYREDVSQRRTFVNIPNL